MWLRGESVRARDPSADRTEGHTRTPLSAQTFGPDLRDDLHADGRSLPRRHGGCLTSKDVRRTLSPCDAPVPVNAAGGAYGNWVCPRFFRRPRAAGTIGRRSSTDTGRLGRRRSRRVSDRRRLGFETRPHRRVPLRRVLSHLVRPLQASSGRRRANHLNMTARSAKAQPGWVD